MVDQYVLERFEAPALSELRSLHAAVHGDQSGFTERKYATEPMGLGPIGFLARDGRGTVAGYYGVFPVPLSRDGATFLAAQSGDTMTHPEHQGKGLFTRLARATNEAAAHAGIHFIFGFPNYNSYPGFVRKLGWVHRRTMVSYAMNVPTVPFSFIVPASRRAALRERQCEILCRMDDVRVPQTLESSVTASVWGGVDRGEGYLAYKKNGLLELRGEAWTVYLKMARFLQVGDIIARDASGMRAAFRVTRRLAARVGSPGVRYHVSPGSPSDVALGSEMRGRAGLPYGHLDLTGSCNPDDFDFTFLDYDTF